MKGPDLSPRGDNSILWKYFHEIFKNHLLQNDLANFNQTWHKAFLGEEDSVCSNEGPHLFLMGDYNEIVKIQFKNRFLQNHWINFNQTWYNVSFCDGNSYFSNHSIFFLLMLWHSHFFAQWCLLIGTVSQMSDVAHGHLVFQLQFINYIHEDSTLLK